MADLVNVKVKLDQAMKLLSELDGNKYKMRRRILSGVGVAVKNKVRKSYKSFFRKQTGTLYKSLNSRVIKNGKAAIVSPSAAKDKVRYGYVLSKGATIEARKGDFLTFRIGDKWVRKHSVTIPERDWVSGPAKRYLASSELKTKLDQLTQREIDKAEKAAQRKASG